MVDLDELDKAKESGGSGTQSSSSSQSQSSQSTGQASNSTSSGVAETHTVSGDDVITTEGKEVSDVAQDWANNKGELNTGANSGEGLQGYMNRQVKEVEELHDNIHQMAMDNNDNFEEFTLYMHALFLNFAQNRVGICETIQENFGKSPEEAMQITDKICSKAGEEEFMEQMVQDISSNLAEI